MKTITALFFALTLMNLPVFAADAKSSALATFGGGCFWCMEPPFLKLDGVIDVVSGFTGGNKANPTYEEASSGMTGHTEAVQVTYNPAKISYDRLVDVFWRNIDPTDGGGQFVDRGNQYRPGIFYHNEEQKKTAEASRAALEKSGRFKAPFATEITAYNKFYPAEDYHQHYFKKSPIRYKYYRYQSGRDEFLDKVWGKDR